MYHVRIHDCELRSRIQNTVQLEAAPVEMGKSKKGLVNTRQKTSLQLDNSKKSDTKRGKELHVLLVVPSCDKRPFFSFSGQPLSQVGKPISVISVALCV